MSTTPFKVVSTGNSRHAQRGVTDQNIFKNPSFDCLQGAVHSLLWGKNEISFQQVGIIQT